MCVYNDEEILEEYLLKSLQNQTAHFQMHLVNNTKNTFKSASEALNHGAEDAEGKYIMFVHQDVYLSADTWLEDTEKVLEQLPLLGAAGVAGKSNLSPDIFTNIKHGNPPRHAGESHITAPMKVHTLDECLIIIPREVFSKTKFDPQVCDNWHLYAVDYCLTIKKFGFNVIALPCHLYHRSDGGGGKLTKDYYKTLTKLLKKYRWKYLLIPTVCGDWLPLLPIGVQLQWPMKLFKRRLRSFYRWRTKD